MNKDMIKTWASIILKESEKLNESEYKDMDFGDFCRIVLGEFEKNPAIGDLPFIVAVDGSEEPHFMAVDKSTHTLKSQRIRNGVYADMFTDDKQKALTLNSVIFEGSVRHADGSVTHETETFKDNLEILLKYIDEKKHGVGGDFTFEIPIGSHYGDSHQVVSDKMYAYLYDVEFGIKGIYLRAYRKTHMVLK